MDGGFFQVPNSLIKAHGKQIGPLGIAVYSAILMHDYGNDRCWPSQSTIAEHLGCDRKTVNRTISKLVDAGLLELDPRFTDKGQTSNRYRPKLVVSPAAPPKPGRRSKMGEPSPPSAPPKTIGYGTVPVAKDEDFPF